MRPSPGAAITAMRVGHALLSERQVVRCGLRPARTRTFHAADHSPTLFTHPQPHCNLFTSAVQAGGRATPGLHMRSPLSPTEAHPSPTEAHSPPTEAHSALTKAHPSPTKGRSSPTEGRSSLTEAAALLGRRTRPRARPR
ncbi:MAG: hypothetical protein WDW36_005041 [Sanguina aurantia]